MPQIQVSGNVHLVGWEGKRVSVWESFDVNGKTFSRLWTAWFPSDQSSYLQEEDWVEIHGELSTKIGKYTTKQGEEKQVVEHHLQNARLIQSKSKEAQSQHASKFDESMPF
jgi:hypothetical protein